MLRLAVATEAETYERLEQILPAHDIEPTPVDIVGQATRIAGSESPIQVPDGVDPERFDVGFVFPPRLAEGGVVDALLDVPWVNDREQVLRSRNKGETLARLAGAGHPVPKTTVVSNPIDEADLVDAYRKFDGPVVLKPNATTRGTGVAKAHDLDSFLGICDYLDLVHDYRATGDRSFLVQEFLPGARDVRAMVIDGEYVGAVERTLPAEAGTDRWKHNVHRGAEASGIELEPEHQTLVEAVAETLEIPWLGVDLLVTEDSVVVSETNARPTIDRLHKYEDGFEAALVDVIRAQV